MCGISGLVNCGSRETLARMTHVQAHRGPDDAGVWEHRSPDGCYVGLGSRRLALRRSRREQDEGECNSGQRMHRLLWHNGGSTRSRRFPEPTVGL